MIDDLFIQSGAFIDESVRPSDEMRERYHRTMRRIAATRLGPFVSALLPRAATTEPHRVELMADLLARHGSDHRESPLQLDEQTRDQLVRMIETWSELMLTSPEANRHQIADVARVAGRVADPRLARILQRMLERDLADWTRARDEHARSGRGGYLTPDVTHSYTLQYRDAFSAIGGDEVVQLMKGWLPDRRFGEEAAQVLHDLWKREHPPAKEKRSWGWRDFSEVRAHRLAREGPPPPATSEYAEAIFEIVRQLAVEGASEPDLRHAIALARVGLYLPHGSKQAEVDRLLTLPLPFAAKQDLLAAYALAGEVISADVLLDGLRELLAAAATQSWRLESNRGELMGLIELFAFSDAPSAVIGGLDLLPERYRAARDLERLLVALGESPHPEVIDVLQALAQRDAAFPRQRAWLTAMINLQSERSALILLDRVCDGSLGGNGGVDWWHLGQNLEGLASKFPALRSEMFRRYTSMERPPRALVHALAETADAATVLAMVAKYATMSRPFDGMLANAIRNAAVGKRPVADWPGAYQEFSVPLGELRKELFALSRAGNAQAPIAEACLTYIEELRDEHGRISDEPRHPDIASGVGWPREATLQ